MSAQFSSVLFCNQNWDKQAINKILSLIQNRTEQNRNFILIHKHIGLMVTAIQYKACNICNIFQYTNIEENE